MTSASASVEDLELVDEPSYVSTQPDSSIDDGIVRCTQSYSTFSPSKARAPYGNYESIDFHYEKGRNRALIAQNRSLFSSLSFRLSSWLIILLTGLTVGLLAASLDILTAWLFDIKEGVCSDDIWLNKASCCMGLEPGEECFSWREWTDIMHISSIAGSSLGQYAIYIILSTIFAVTASYLVGKYAPFAYHSGIPEMKAILGGYTINGFLSNWTLVIKALTLPLAVASSLSLGKEGPLVHVATCVGNFFANRFEIYRGNQALQREILSASAAAGLSTAFGAPVGGVLFSLEEASSYFPMHVLWQAFVTAVIAAITVQYMDVSQTGKLVLFQVTTNQVFRIFEIFPFLFLGVCGGVAGHYFTKLNIEIARMRNGTESIRTHPVIEVAVVTLVTSITSYLIPFLRIPTSRLVQALFTDCSTSSVDLLGICDRDRIGSVTFFLVLATLIKYVLTVVTFGMQIPAGIFLPSTAIGAAFGRAVGLLMSSWQRNYPTMAIFSSCPPDEICINPTAYAVVGAASMLSGVTRLSLSLLAIFFELTGAIDLVLQIMLSVAVAKFMADYLSQDGIYESWINLHNYPFLNPKVDYRSKDHLKASDVMTPLSELVVLERIGVTLGEIDALLTEEPFRGFPIVKSRLNPVLLGYISRNQLLTALNQARSYPGSHSDMTVQFCPAPLTRKGKANELDQSAIDLRPWVEENPVTMSSDASLEDVVQLFQRIGLRHLLLKRHGKLTGYLTKHDCHYIVRQDKHLESDRQE